MREHVGNENASVHVRKSDIQTSVQRAPEPQTGPPFPHIPRLPTSPWHSSFTHFLTAYISLHFAWREGLCGEKRRNREELSRSRKTKLNNQTPVGFPSLEDSRLPPHPDDRRHLSPETRDMPQLHFPPKLGDGICFFSLSLSLSPQQFGRHGGRPVARSEVTGWSQAE